MRAARTVRSSMSGDEGRVDAHRAANRRRRWLVAAGCLAAAACCLAPHSARAQSGTWNVTTSGSWSDTANWLGGVVASGTGSMAVFNNDITSNVAVTLDAPRTLAWVYFGDAGTGTPANWTLDNGGNAANVLKLSNTTDNHVVLTVDAMGTGASATISSAIDATGVSGYGVFIRSGVGTLTISGSFLGPSTNMTLFDGVGTTNLTGPYVQTEKFIMQNGATVNWSATTGVLSNSYFGVGDGNSNGTFNMTSGSIAHNYFGGMFIGNGSSSVGVMTISGGTFSEVNASANLWVGAGYYGGSAGTESGTLTISGGGLYAFGGGGSIKLSSGVGSRGTINLDSGGTFQLNSRQITAGSGVATFSFNGGTLRLSANNTGIFSTTVTPTIGAGGATVNTNGFDGSFANNAITGAGSLTKAGAGTLTLAQASASWTGKSIVTGGTLAVDSDTKLGAAPGSFVADQVNLNGGSLRWAGNATMNANRGITLTASSGTLALNNSSFTYNGRFTGAGNTLGIGGVGDIVLANATGVASSVNFNLLGSSRLFYNGLNALGTGTITVNSGNRLVSQGSSPGIVPNVITVLSGGGISARTSGTYTNVALPTSGMVTFNLDDGSTTDLVIRSNQSLATGTSLTVSMDSGGGTVGAATLSGTISGAGQLVKTGVGQLNLTGTSTYSGGTLLAGGTLSISSDRSLGAVPGSFSANNLTISGGATLRGPGVSLAVAANRGITISGTGYVSGGITVSSRFTSGTAGSVLAIRDGDNVFQNQTGTPSDVNIVLMAGGARLLYDSTNSLGTGSVEVNANATLVGNLAGSIGNAITVNNGGQLSARSAVTYTNVTLPQSGTVRLNYDDQATTTLTIASPITLASGSTLTVEMLQQTSNAIGPAVFSGAISGAGGLEKTGSGVLRLTGNNSYGGATTVSLGTLIVNGTNTGTGGVTIASGALLGGSGWIAGLTTVSGTLSPGNSPGEINFDMLTLEGTSTTLMEITGTSRGSAYDGVNVLTAGGLTYGGTLALSFTSLFADHTTFDLFSFTGSPAGGLAAITTSGSYGSLTFTGSNGVWTSTEFNGQTMTFTESTGDLVIVPEPFGVVLAASGVACGAAAIRRRRRRPSR